MNFLKHFFLWLDFYSFLNMIIKILLISILKDNLTLYLNDLFSRPARYC